MRMSAEASLSIEINVECPNEECGDYFDLMKIEGLNDEGQLLSVACPSKGHWSESHEKFNLDIACPACNQKIKIDGIGW